MGPIRRGRCDFEAHVGSGTVGGAAQGARNAAGRLQGVFKWVEGRPQPGKPATLVYNRDHSELRHKKNLVLHVGCNNWERQEKEVLVLNKMDDAGAERAGVSRGDWYTATLPAVPAHARRLDFVLSDKDLQVRAFHAACAVCGVAGAAVMSVGMCCVMSCGPG